jgi:proline iminopeptidase
MRARIRDTEIFFDIEGAGLVPEGCRMREKPVAFLIHGGPGGDHTSMKLAFSSLAERIQLIAFDQRGQGRSARGDPRQYTLDENVEDMEALRQHLGTGPIVSVGMSYGGVVAMAHAIRYPRAVSHLILIVTAAHSGFIASALRYVAEHGTKEQVALCEDLFAGRIDDAEKMRHYYEVMGPMYALRHDAPAAKTRLARAILEPEAFNRVYGPTGCLRQFDLRPKLPSIQTPTLIIAGRHDWICPPEFSEEIRERIPGSDLRIFERSGHAVLGDETQQCLDAIAGFIVYRRSASAPHRAVVSGERPA